MWFFVVVLRVCELFVAALLTLSSELYLVQYLLHQFIPSHDRFLSTVSSAYGKSSSLPWLQVAWL